MRYNGYYDGWDLANDITGQFHYWQAKLSVLNAHSPETPKELRPHKFAQQTALDLVSNILTHRQAPPTLIKSIHTTNPHAAGILLYWHNGTLESEIAAFCLNVQTIEIEANREMGVQGETLKVQTDWDNALKDSVIFIIKYLDELIAGPLKDGSQPQ